MDNKQTIRFKWDSNSKTGTMTLILDMKILEKYALPMILNTYNPEYRIGSIISPYDSFQQFEPFRLLIEGYKNLLSMYSLDQESKFHGSHILLLIMEHGVQQLNVEEQQEIRRRLHNRLYLLKHLMELENYNKYNIEIYDTVMDSFRYHFGSEPILKRSIIKYMIGEMKSQLKDYDLKLYKLLMSGAGFDELEAAVKRQSIYEIKKAMVPKLAKKIVKYLNNETKVLSNPNKVDELSVSNAQGDFIYDILTHVELYEPKQRSNTTVVKHHDSIRKLIKRAAIFDEDKEDLI